MSINKDPKVLTHPLFTSYGNWCLHCLLKLCVSHMLRALGRFSCVCSQCLRALGRFSCLFSHCLRALERFPCVLSHGLRALAQLEAVASLPRHPNRETLLFTKRIDCAESRHGARPTASNSVEHVLLFTKHSESAEGCYGVTPTANPRQKHVQERCALL